MSRMMMPDERVLWEGRPAWRAVARDVLYLGWLAFYVGLLLIWHAADNRSAGLGAGETLLTGIPLAVLCLMVLGALAGFARVIAATTTYTLTSERCVLDFGVALTARLSIPLRRIASVSIAVRADGTGDILLAMKPGTPMGFLKLWPHVRPWRFSRAQPMLRGVVDAAQVAATLSQATAQVCAGTLHAVPGEPRLVISHRPVSQGPLAPVLSPAGD